MLEWELNSLNAEFENTGLTDFTKLQKDKNKTNLKSHFQSVILLDLLLKQVT